MKTIRIFTSLFLSTLMTIPSYADGERDAMVDQLVFTTVAADASHSDGKAAVYQMEGKALITSQGSPVERDLKIGDEIGIGDAIYTEKGASLSISFDSRKQNAVRIPADTKATFTSIEPTDIKLDDGTIFSIVNGLAKGSTWKVTTPSAVAAVRGTVFETTYHADTKEFFAATLDVADDGKTSAIEIESLSGQAMVEIIEGKEISFKEGETPSSEMVQDFSSEKMAEVQQFHQEVATEREKSDDNSNGNNGGGNGPGGPSGPAGGNGPADRTTASATSPHGPNTMGGSTIMSGMGNSGANVLGVGGLAGLMNVGGTNHPGANNTNIISPDRFGGNPGATYQQPTTGQSGPGGPDIGFTNPNSPGGVNSPGDRPFAEGPGAFNTPFSNGPGGLPGPGPGNPGFDGPGSTNISGNFQPVFHPNDGSGTAACPSGNCGSSSGNPCAAGTNCV